MHIGISTILIILSHIPSLFNSRPYLSIILIHAINKKTCCKAVIAALSWFIFTCMHYSALFLSTVVLYNVSSNYVWRSLFVYVAN